jgi:hypothetical protein
MSDNKKIDMSAPRAHMNRNVRRNEELLLAAPTRSEERRTRRREALLMAREDGCEQDMDLVDLMELGGIFPRAVWG